MLLSPQLNLGEIYIGDIKINLNSRDNIPRILLGLQSVCQNKQAHQEIESLLVKSRRKKDVSQDLGIKYKFNLIFLSDSGLFLMI